MDPGIDVPVVELLVEDEEQLILLNERSNLFCFGPGRRLEILLSQLGERVLVQVGNFVAVTFLDHVPEVGKELPDGVWDEGRVSAELTFVLAIHVRVASMAVFELIVLKGNRITFICQFGTLHHSIPLSFVYLSI